MRRQYHLIACTNIQTFEDNEQRIMTIAHTNGIFSTIELCICFFKIFQTGAQYIILLIIKPLKFLCDFLFYFRMNAEKRDVFDGSHKSQYLFAGKNKANKIEISIIDNAVCGVNNHIYSRWIIFFQLLMLHNTSTLVTCNRIPPS